ncbi:YqaA family protein [Halobacteriovorax sp.]|uniref:YqaA family protein n=1 Tax=Halobacteriovorax sp. TaxID=2020862 RepID=UPI003563049B
MAATILPISSELHFAYITNLSSDEDIIIALFVATLGNSLGGLSCYILGHLGKWSWLEKYFKIEETKILKYKTKLESFGGWPALLCWLPIIGDPIAVTYGLMKAPLRSFVIFMSLGKFLRYLFIIYII